MRHGLDPMWAIAHAGERNRAINFFGDTSRPPTMYTHGYRQDNHRDNDEVAEVNRRRRAGRRLETACRGLPVTPRPRLSTARGVPRRSRWRRGRCDHHRVGEYLWTQHIRDNCPLEPLLKDKARTARENAGFAKPTGSTVEQIVDQLSKNWTEFAQPLVVSGQPEPDGEPQREYRHDREGPDSYPYWRWAYRVPISGDIELLERWPEQLEREPLGEHQFEPPSGPLLRSGNGCVYIFADAPHDQDPDGVAPPVDQVSAAAGYLADAIAAVNAQVAAYDHALRAELEATVDARLARLASIAQGNAAVIDLIVEQLGSLELTPAEGGPTVEVVVAGPELGEPVAVDLNFVLNDGSVANLLEVIGKWRHGVERYPATYAKLKEEDISSLLVTTLNTVFDSAHREVFQGEGKTDIFVQADTGSYERAAHIAEAKIWGGQGQVPTDLGQLLGYGTASTFSQLLLYYVRPEQLSLVVQRCKQAVTQSSTDGDLEDRGPYDFATNVTHPKFGTTVRLTVMFVHVPKAGAVDPDEQAEQTEP